MKKICWIVIGILFLISGCISMKVVDDPTDEITTEGMGGNVKQGKITGESYGDIYWTYIGQVKGKYHVFDYKIELTPEIRNKIRILEKGKAGRKIDEFPNGKWLEGKLNIRCDKFFRFNTMIIKDINGEILYRVRTDEWGKWRYTSGIDNLCKDTNICGWEKIK